jgi:hypothetical protein
LRWRVTFDTGETASFSGSMQTPTSISPRQWIISISPATRVFFKPIIAFSSDWLYPPYQSKDIVKALKMNGLDVTYCEITSDYGHDAFLIEFDEETILIKHFLEKVMRKGENTT